MLNVQGRIEVRGNRLRGSPYRRGEQGPHVTHDCQIRVPKYGSSDCQSCLLLYEYEIPLVGGWAWLMHLGRAAQNVRVPGLI